MPLSKPYSKSVPSVCNTPFLWTQQRTSSSSAAPQPSCCFWPGERQGDSPMGPRSPCSWTSWRPMAAVRPSARLGEDSGCGAEAGYNRASARTVLSCFTTGVMVLPATSLLPGSTLRPASTCLSLHQPPDLPAGGWDTGQHSKRRPRRPSQAEEGPVSPGVPGPPCSPSLFHPFPSLSLFTPFRPPSSSSPLTSIPCLPRPVLLTM